MTNRRKKIIMVDFWSVTDEAGKPLGHGLKVGNEYYSYVREDYEVIQCVNCDMLSYIDNPNKKALVPSISYKEKKISRVIKNLKALAGVYHQEADAIWFYVPDIYLFLFLLSKKKRNKKIAVNVYEQYQTNWLKHRLFKLALGRIDRIFVTNEKLKKDIPQGILIPDYTYDEEEYGSSYRREKKGRAICLGTMNEKKRLRESVEAFTENGYPLYIVGQFSNKELYAELVSIKGDNIRIEDRYVDTNEYYELLSESKYCLIPYDADFYKNRTSGVIQESLFCNAIPISHKRILEFSGVPGLGYEDITDLGEYDLNTVGDEYYCDMFDKLRREKYNRERVKQTVIEAFM